MRATNESPAWQRSGQLVALMLALSIVFVPLQGASWTLVLVGFLLAGLPLLLAEQALAVRAKQASIAGMQLLTRESDAPRYWRTLAYNNLLLSVALSALLAVASGLLATQAIQTLWQPVTATLGLASSAVPAGGALWPVMTLVSVLIALGRSFRTVPMVLWLVVFAALIALLLAQMLQHQTLPLTTDLPMLMGLTQAEGARASLLAGALMGAAGIGAAAALRAQYGEMNSIAARWGFGLILVLGFLALHHGNWCAVAALLGVTVTQLALSASLAPAFAEANARQLPALAAPVLVIIPVTLLAESIWLFGGGDTLAVLSQYLAYAVAFNLLVLSLYTGWVMKMSHLRKAVNLPSELLYNVLRIALRWLAPITLLLAVAYAQAWL